MPGLSLSTERVWSELHANIRGFVARRVRQQADVDDIVQRVFLRVHRALPALRDTEKLHAWIISGLAGTDQQALQMVELPSR
jgi:RNA polymerase sigma-70 factor, ECF subfamily